MEFSAEVAALIDELCERHPHFRRTTIERLVIRTARELEDAPLASVQVAANAQLTYVEQVDPGVSVRRSG